MLKATIILNKYQQHLFNISTRVFNNIFLSIFRLSANFLRYDLLVVV